MKKKFALLLVAVLVLSLPLTVVARDWWLTIRFEIVSESISDAQNIQVGLFYDDILYDYVHTNNMGIAGFDLDFTLSDIPDLRIEIMSGQLNGLSIPLIDFVHEGSGILTLSWQMSDANQATPEPDPITEPDPVTTTEPEPDPEPATEPPVVQPPVTPPPPQETRLLRFPIGVASYTYNGVQHTMEAASFVSDEGRTMVPLRVIGEALGATDLSHSAGVITFNLSDQVFTMTVGEELPNGMGTPVIVNERTFVPLAFIINEMGAEARWDSSARAAYIYILQIK